MSGGDSDGGDPSQLEALGVDGDEFGVDEPSTPAHHSKEKQSSVMAVVSRRWWVTSRMRLSPRHQCLLGNRLSLPRLLVPCASCRKD